MRKLFTLCLLIVSLSASAQWQQTGSKVRYVNGLGIPTKDTAAGVAADSSQILIRPADSSLYIKYKRTWVKVGSGGTIGGSGTTNYIPKFTSSTAIGNSQIFDNGTGVGIGTASPTTISGYVGTTTNGTSGSWHILAMGGTNKSIFETGGSVTQLKTLVSEPLIFGTNNVERMRITSGGNALIGTTTDNGTDRLQVSGSMNVSARATAQNLSVTSTTTTTGNVGIFNSAPFYALSVGDGTTTRQIVVNGANSGTAGGSSLAFQTNSVTRFMIGNVSNIIGGAFDNTPMFYFADGCRLYDGNASSDRIRIFSNGNTAIGSSSDNGTDRLQVSGSASVTSLLGVGTSPSAGTVHIKTTSPSIVLDDNDNAGTAAIRFRPQSASFATRGSIELVSTGSAAPTRFVIASTDTMTFRTNSIERMRITSAGGNVLISKTTDNGIDKLQVNGSIDAKGFAQAYTTKGATYTAATSDYLIDCTSGTFTVNLPDALLNVGRILVIKNSGTGTITVDGFSTQTIDGATTYSLSAQWATVQIMCDGSNWKIISKF